MNEYKEINEYKKRQYILQRWSTKMQLNYFLVDRFLRFFSYKELCREFIINEKQEGKSYKRLSITYRLSVKEIRTICDNARCKEKNLPTN